MTENSPGTPTPRPENIVAAAQRLADVWVATRPMECGEIFINLQCSEVQPLIDLFIVLGQEQLAGWVLDAHAASDYETGDDHHSRYLELSKSDL